MPRKPSKSATKRRLDTEFKRAQRQRVGMCEMCARSWLEVQLHAHHAVVGCQNHRCRFEPRNIAVLCAEHHRWAHDNPSDFHRWFERNRPEDLAYIDSIKNDIVNRSVHDYLDMIAELREAA